MATIMVVLILFSFKTIDENEKNLGVTTTHINSKKSTSIAIQGMAVKYFERKPAPWSEVVVEGAKKVAKFVTKIIGKKQDAIGNDIILDTQYRLSKL